MSDATVGCRNALALDGNDMLQEVMSADVISPLGANTAAVVSALGQLESLAAEHRHRDMPDSIEGFTEGIEFAGQVKDEGSFNTLCSLLEAVMSPQGAHTRALALFERYRSLEGMMLALANDFTNEEIFTRTERHLLRAAKDVSASVLRENLQRNPLIGSPAQLRDYLRISLAHERREVTRLLFLDTKNRLIADELHGTGTFNHTPVYPREVVCRALVRNASGLIVCHNHPSGDPSPSEDDLEMTRMLFSVLRQVGVRLIDHIIVGLRTTASLRELGHLTFIG